MGDLLARHLDPPLFRFFGIVDSSTGLKAKVVVTGNWE